jgi:hypothetical protein
MVISKFSIAGAMLAAAAAPGIASATFVLDTGTPTANGTTFSLDANDFYAAEFNLAAGSTVTSIQAYVTNALFEDSPGDTFTLSIYSANNFLNNRNASAVFATQGTYGSNANSPDGWNGASGLSWTATAGGNYWVALEVNPLGGDTAVALGLPSPTGGGTAPALDLAFNDGSGYTDQGAMPFGIQVAAVAPVPLPPSLWLFACGALGLGLGGVRRNGRSVSIV